MSAISSASDTSGTRSEPASQFFKQGTLGRHTLKILNRAHLEFLLQAFLMRQPGQRIYLAGDAATVARLLWGLTNSLPRTLTIVEDLTFSTYEPLEAHSHSGVYHAPIDQQQPTIVGTCWPQTQEHELPLSYYHADGVNGFALNCYNGRKTPLTPNKFTARFASYAVDCLLEENNHTIAELREILAQAEQEQCRELYHFVRIFNAFQTTLAQEDVLYLLRSINENLDDIADHAAMLLTDIARLRRPNVLKSIVARIAENRYWWESSCLPELDSFYAFLVKYTSLPMPADIEAILDSLHSVLNELCEQIAIQVTIAIRNNQEESMYFWNDMLEKSAPLQHTEPAWLMLLSSVEMEDLEQPTYLLWWKICGQRVMGELHQASAGVASVHEPDMPLNHLGSMVANKIQVALQHNDIWALGAWSQTFAQVASPDQEAVAWIYLLQTLVTSPYTPLYWDWWNSHGKQGVKGLAEALQAAGNHIPRQLPALCNGLISNTVMIVRRANPATGIQGSGRQEWLFWHEVLSVLMPLRDDYEQAHAVWLNLWGSLWPYIFNPAFAQWWHPRGMRAAQAICSFVEKHPQSERANDLIAFIFESIVPLTHQQIERMLEQNRADREQALAWDNYQSQLFLLLEILAVSTPQQIQLAVWDTPAQQSTATSTHGSYQPLSNLDAEDAPLDAEETNAAKDTEETNNGEAIQIASDEDGEHTAAQTDLIHDLARTLANQPADQTYPWDALRFLLETWSTMPTLHATTKVAPWLYVSWQSIGNLLATPFLPLTWQIQAVLNVLSTTITLQPHQIITLVVEHQALFATALKHLLEQSATEQEAIDFFQYLLDFGYPQKPELLSLLLLRSLDQPEQINALLEHADLTHKEMVSLLEHHCTEIIEHIPWPTGISTLVQHYLYDLDIAQLNRPTTRAFLHSLALNEPHQPEQLSPTLRNAIVGWDSIRTFMEPGTDTATWLQDEAQHSQYLASVPLSKRARLQEKLTSELVKVLRHETSIIDALHSLSPLYNTTDEQLDPGTPEDRQAHDDLQGLTGLEDEENTEHNAPFAPGLRLLHDLSEQAGLIFAGEQPPIHLLPYLKLILIYAQDLVGESKERYLDSSLHALLLHVKEPQQEQINAHTALWFPELRQDWQRYSQRQPVVHEQAIISYFRKTLRTGDVETVTQAYQRVLREVHYPATRINAQERECAQLARDVVIAYNTRDSELLHQAYQNIQNSPYTKTIRYTPAIQQAIERVSGIAQIAPPAQQITPPPAQPLIKPEEQAPVAPRLPFPSSPSYHSYSGLPLAGDISQLKTIDQSEQVPDTANDLDEDDFAEENLDNGNEMEEGPDDGYGRDERDEDLDDDDEIEVGKEQVENEEEALAPYEATPPIREQLRAQSSPRHAALSSPQQPQLAAASLYRAETEQTTGESSIGTVLAEPITLLQLDRVYALKRLYIDFRVHHLTLRMKNLPAPEKKFYGYEIKTLNEQQEFSDEALRACALDDLVDDIFIQHNIDEQMEHDSKLTPAYFALHPQITARFIAYDPSEYRTLCNEYHLAGQDSSQVLGLFRRRELLAHYLFLKQQKTVFDQLDRWLAQERRNQHQQIEIDPERAGLQPGKKATPTTQAKRSGFLSALRRRP